MFTLPNFLTLLNLLFGCLGLITLTQGNDSLFFIFFALSLLCDLADGWVARATGSESKIGKELDSFADMVSFGFVPGYIAYLGLKNSAIIPIDDLWIAAYGFLITLSAALRLTKFNLAKGSGVYFYGLPTPSMAIYVAGLYFVQNDFYLLEPILKLPNSSFLWWISVPVLAILMHLPVPMFSVKAGKRNSMAIGFMLGFLILGIVSFFLMNTGAFALIIALYILLSYVHWILNRNDYEI